MSIIAVPIQVDALVINNPQILLNWVLILPNCLIWTV
jgi:hypothetical protein